MLKILMHCLWGGCCVVVLYGCFSKVPQVQYYELNAEGGALEVTSTSFTRMLSWEIDVAPKIASKKIAYKDHANAIAYFSRNAWIEPFPILLQSLMQKVAANLGISNAKDALEHLKIEVLDCYFDTQKEQVFVRILVEFNGSRSLFVRVASVESGGFIRIIEAFERVFNALFVEILTKESGR